MKENEDQLLFHYHERNDREVARRIRAGQTDFITGTGWALLDEFFIFLQEVGFYRVLEEVGGKGYQRIMVALIRLLTTYSVKVLLGIAHLRQVPSFLFRDVGLLKRIGFTATEIREGVCKRGKGRSRPMHQKILGDLLCRLTKEEVFGIFNRTIKSLSRKGYIKEHIFILDTSPLKTTKRYENCGMKTVTEKKWDRVKRQVVEITKQVYGFKIGMIQGASSQIPASCTFAQIQVNDSNFTQALVEEAEANMGRRIKLLLIDCGFLDGETLWWLHKRGIHFITRARTNMAVTIQMRSFRDDSPGDGLYQEKRGDLEIVAVEGLTTYDQYGEAEHTRRRNRKDFEANPINGVMVLKFGNRAYPPGKEPVFITDLPVDKPLAVMDSYDLRSLIENKGFRELKQGWHLEKFPVKKEAAVRAHVILTLLMYGLNAAYQTERGQKEVARGIRRLRREDYQSIHKIVVYSGPYFGIFDIEEYSIITRAPPKEFARTNIATTRRRLGLGD